MLAVKVNKYSYRYNFSKLKEVRSFLNVPLLIY